MTTLALSQNLFNNRHCDHDLILLGVQWHDSFANSWLNYTSFNNNGNREVRFEDGKYLGVAKRILFATIFQLK
jgi:hypothetical protein